MKSGLLTLSMLVYLFLWLPLTSGELKEKKNNTSEISVPILLYHRFGPTVSDSMTVTTPVFESHLRHLKENNYTVIPLGQLIDCYIKGQAPPRRSVAIVVDDGHKTVYTDMLPLIKKYRVPVTLFLYPSAISNASYAMTWQQARELKKTGFFDFQSHTYWHPNFNKEKKRQRADEYEKFVDMQLKKSKEKLEKELGSRVDMLAWPFGIFDDWLAGKAAEAGYIAAFTIERHHANGSDNIMTLPRYLLTDKDRGKVFEGILNRTSS